MSKHHITFLNEAADYFEQRPTNGEDRSYWSNVFNAEKCRKIAKDIEATSKDYNLLQEKHDELLLEVDRLRDVLRINTEQQADHIRTLLKRWEIERNILTKEIATYREAK